MIVLDASVLIALLDTDDRHHDRAYALLGTLLDDRFAAGPVTLAEVLVGPTRSGSVERVEAALHRLEVTTVPLDGAAPRRLAALRASTGLKLRDCCVLLAAEQVGGAVATFDDKLAAAGRALGLDVRGA